MQVELYWRCFPYISEASILIIIKLLVLISLQWISNFITFNGNGQPHRPSHLPDPKPNGSVRWWIYIWCKKANEHALKRFWMRHLWNNTLAAGVQWVTISESYSFQLDSRGENSFVRIWSCLRKIYSCLCWDVIHLEEALTLCELGQQHQCTSKATLPVTMPLSGTQHSQLSAGPWKGPLRSA